jgi:hypothetical protein
LSSCKVEYIALKKAVKEVLYLLNIFNYINNNLKLEYTNSIPQIIVNNKSVIKLGENPKFHKSVTRIDNAQPIDVTADASYISKGY